MYGGGKAICLMDGVATTMALCKVRSVPGTDSRGKTLTSKGGSNADNVLADAYVKHVPGINWTEAYQAMLKDAEVTSYNSYNPTDLTNGIQQGRGALYDWLPLGYLGVDTSTRSISRTVEYALNDFSVATVAKGIAPDDVNKYMNRSANWQNLWAHNVTHKGFTGFLAPRLSTGQFNLTDYNPALCDNGCEWSSYTYEGVPFGKKNPKSTMF